VTAQLLTAVLVVGAPALKAPPKPSILGDWELQSVEFEGERQPFAQETMVFSPDGTLREFVDGKPERRTTYKVDTAATPAELDWHENDAKKFRRAIWKVEGDTLTIANNPIPGGARPTSFTSPVGSKFFVLTYKRAQQRN
jgi:uncharacterized protein (TIGR03067 family)